ncbi:Nn.00g077570.m01.CDS01 [Neocucurbitaria sp. VM-36]
MYIILPISHIPCTHIVSKWQHCSVATLAGNNSLQPCWDIRHHDRAIPTCDIREKCDGARFIARRNGVAERGNGSRPATPDEHDSSSIHDEAEDSGYQSEVTHEEEDEKAFDHEDIPLSPRATAPPRVRGRRQRTERKQKSANHRPSMRKASWRPNLKRELALDDVSVSYSRRDSIDAMIVEFDSSIQSEAELGGQTVAMRTEESTSTTATIMDFPQKQATTTKRSPYPKRRESTLLHPSSPPPPPVEPPTTTQPAPTKAFPFPKFVHTRTSSMEHTSSLTSTTMGGASTLRDTAAREVEGQGRLHLQLQQQHIEESSSTVTREVKSQRIDIRRPSTLLHPSCPLPSSCSSCSSSSSSSTISNPFSPQHDHHHASHRARPPHPTRTPILFTSWSAPTAYNTTINNTRRASVLHSCLSDSEEDELEEDTDGDGEGEGEDVCRFRQKSGTGSLEWEGWGVVYGSVRGRGSGRETELVGGYEV